jgi:hypothetical protein
MAGSKDAVLIAAFAVFLGQAAALDFDVNVEPTPEAGIFQPNSTHGNYFNASASIENPGSVGCEFRVKGDIQQGGQDLTRYSAPYSMWPGDIDRAEFLYLPINYTGKVEANLSLQYCDREKNIDSYSFNMSERVIPNSTIKSKTLEVNKTNALVSLGVEEAVLIPQQYPAYWKVGSVRVNNSRALIEYDPTLFKKGEEIEYTVIRNGTVEGKTKVVLEDQEAWHEELFRELHSMF